MLINDLSARVSAHKQEIDTEIANAVASGWFVLGSRLKKFEAEFADYLGAATCVGVANGTDAIELALRAMGIRAGDKVGTVANAGMYTSTALLAIGSDPFFLDVDIESKTATAAEVRRAIEAGVKAVVVTHLYGQATSEIAEIAKICTQHDVKLLEDCAQAHGASIDGQRVGTFGDASSFSFYPTKNLGALGDGGAVVTNNADIAERVSRLRQYGWSHKYRVEWEGGRNSRLDEVQAAILSVFLPHLDASNARRREIAETYGRAINNADVCLPTLTGDAYVGHLYVVRSTHRNALAQHLRDRDIASDVHYPIPDYRQPVFGDRFSHLQLKNTEQLASEVLTLPCYPEMTGAQVDQVIAGVNTWQP